MSTLLVGFILAQFGCSPGSPNLNSLDSCTVVADCAASVSECRTAVDCKNARCVFQDALAGAPVIEQTAGDCTELVCNGKGNIEAVPSLEDFANDGNPCTIDTCEGTIPIHVHATLVPCYSGPSGTKGVGVCHSGIQTCDALGYPVGGCANEVVPEEEESCISPLDEDCDGLADEGLTCVCIPGSTKACYGGPGETEGVGACRAGTATCTPDGLPGPCLGDVKPTSESCDAGMTDEDCDGQVNEEGDGCFCGDGFVSTDIEDCDDGNTLDGDGCPGTCTRVVTSLAVGGLFACAILDDGRLKCWGNNQFGQLGLGDMNNRGDGPDEMRKNLPEVVLGNGQSAVSLALGDTHMCAVLNDGTVKCWGQNTYGQLGASDTANRGDEPNEMGDSLLAVDLGTGNKAIAVSAGLAHTCALLEGGSVKCWGWNAFGQLGLGDTANRGDDVNEMGEALPVVDLGAPKKVKAIACGQFHSCALFDDGSVKCWGLNSSGELGLGDTSSRGATAGTMGDLLPPIDLGTTKTATAVYANRHTCVILQSGNVKCWGWNSDGNLGVGDVNHRGDEPGEMGTALPIIDFGILSPAVSLGVGNSHSCAVLSDATVRCWGSNGFGELGLGDNQTRGDQPEDMGNMLPAVNWGTVPVTRVVPGGYSTCVILQNGRIKCCGLNAQGQLGLGDTQDRGGKASDMGYNLPYVSL